MNRIKKFESFSTNHREPTEVSYDDWLYKYDIHGKEIFNKKEIQFFNNLVEENRLDIETYYIDEVKISIMMMIESTNGDEDLVEFEFKKLTDEWYLVSKIYNQDPDYEQFFICDEWDEVLGYLKSINLTLPS
jgi:hypothetical protein